LTSGTAISFNGGDLGARLRVGFVRQNSGIWARVKAAALIGNGFTTSPLDASIRRVDADCAFPLEEFPMKAICLVALLALAAPALAFAEDTVPPDPPASIQAEYVPNSVTLNWTPSPSLDVVSYRVYYDGGCDVVPGCEDALVATIGASDPLTFTGPFGEITFGLGWRNYTVYAVDGAGNVSAGIRPSLVGVDGPGAGQLVFTSPAPNPSRGDVVFSWTMPRAGTARLAIIDLAGRTVRLVSGGLRAAGPQRVTWDGRDARGQMVRPGAYFAKLDSPWGSRSRMLVRTN
jgi:hypothetical protein